MLVDLNSLLAVFSQLCLLFPRSCVDAGWYPRNHSQNLGTGLDLHPHADRSLPSTTLHAIAVLSNPHSHN